MPSKHLILCCSLLLPSIFPSLRVFSNELALGIRWPKYWRFSFSISPFNEYPGFDLLAVQGTLQLNSSKASILQCSALFMVQLPHTYVTIGKNQSFHYMDICWQSNMLSRLVIAFLPRSKHLLIPLLQSPSAVILDSNFLKYWLEKVLNSRFPKDVHFSTQQSIIH